MNHEKSHLSCRAGVVAVALVLLACVPGAWAQTAPPAQEPEKKPTMTIYGFAMLDIGQNFTSINPDWYDTMRVSKLPSYDKQYGEDGSTFAGVRQTGSASGRRQQLYCINNHFSDCNSASCSNCCLQPGNLREQQRNSNCKSNRGNSRIYLPMVERGNNRNNFQSGTGKLFRNHQR